MAKPTHKHRARKMLEALGYAVFDCEQRDPWSRKTYDLFGIIDLLAFDFGDQRTVAIQVTASDSGGNVSKRLKKCLESPALPACLRAGWRVEVWGVRDKEVRDGSPVAARCFQLSEDGEHVVALEGSEVLDI